MFIKKSFIFTSIFMLLCCSLFSDDTNVGLQNTDNVEIDFKSMFNRASRIYNEGNKDEALDLYMSMLQNGINSSSVYYNIGNIYMEKEQYAKAILYYEKSLRLVGYDKDLQNNIRFAYRNVGSDESYKSYNVAYFPLFFYMNKISVIFVLISTLVLFFVILFLFIFDLKIKYSRKNILVTFLSIFIFSFVIYLGYNYVLSENFLIIQSSEGYIRDGASENSKNIYNLSLGEKIRIIESHENWYYVKIDSGRYGWIVALDGDSIL